MKILIVHNKYQIEGGEDAVFYNESSLVANIHKVEHYVVNNDHITSFIGKLSAALGVVFSVNQYRKLKAKLIETKPDIVHIHNYFPVLSPTIFYACKSLNIPVVHTLHNYRAICPTALLMHDGKVDEKSIHQGPWWAISKRVYRGSLIGTMLLAIMISWHRFIGTWQRKVDRFIALTEFQKSKYIEAGWPAEKIAVKPNFVNDPFKDCEMPEKAGGYAIFVGRLSQEKGIDILLESWRTVNYPLKIIGDGPLKSLVEQSNNNNIEYLGKKEKPELFELVRNADFIVMPSTWYEGFPMVLVEAFACGTPAVVSNLGSMAEIVTPSESGLHFTVGNAMELSSRINEILSDRATLTLMGENARANYLTKYTSEQNLQKLMTIYHDAIASSQVSSAKNMRHKGR